MSNISDDTLMLSPTISMRTLSVPGTPGSPPAAPLKRLPQARSHPSSQEGSTKDSPSDSAEPRDLSAAFDAVVTKSEPSLETAASVISPVDYRDAVEHSLSVPVPQAPVKPDALPAASLSQRANALNAVEDEPDTAPADDVLDDIAKPVTGTPVQADEAEICPPSPPQSKPLKETALPTEPILELPKGAPLPHNEAERLRTVALLGILDQPEDPVLASITKLVTRLLKVSTAGLFVHSASNKAFTLMGSSCCCECS